MLLFVEHALAESVVDCFALFRGFAILRLRASDDVIAMGGY